ncbi:hypothetical protein ABW21_db0208556 [Orbilia brochopaga]|nr:hypothetical protein ABW21_db0208556 [Drechslerella brochopaga]
MTAQFVPSHTASAATPSLNMQDLDLEKPRLSVAESDDSTIRVPFSTKRTSRKFFFATLVLSNILLIALIVGLAVGLSLHLKNNQSANGSPSPSPTTTGDSNAGAAYGPGSGPNRHS